MNQQARDVLLTGWIRPDESYFSGRHNLSLLVIGHFAGEQVSLRVDLVDADRHGYPYDADDRITRVYGNWLELSGSFRASPIDDRDSDREHLGYLDVAAVAITTRTDAKPRQCWDRHLPLRTLTVLFPKAIRSPHAATASADLLAAHEADQSP